MKTITLNIDDRLVETARRIAADEHTTLEAKVREWLEGYAQKREQAKSGEGATQRMTRGELAVATARELRKKHPTGGRKFTREEMNER
ncbi:MAG: hypothetical protein OXF52_06585 [Candidatus Dadabacteria bacterium]|nr:hypothetical protein [Candidatus Dadabacteria bacterium]